MARLQQQRVQPQALQLGRHRHAVQLRRVCVLGQHRLRSTARRHMIGGPTQQWAILIGEPIEQCAVLIGEPIEQWAILIGEPIKGQAKNGQFAERSLRSTACRNILGEPNKQSEC